MFELNEDVINYDVIPSTGKYAVKSKRFVFLKAHTTVSKFQRFFPCLEVFIQGFVNCRVSSIFLTFEI